MKYYIIAGEASGDLHGANLMQQIRNIDSSAQFRFWGGDKMTSVAGTPVRHIKDLAIMGFVEVLLHLRTILHNISFCKKDILLFSPDILIGIDYPGFNLKIESWAHSHGFKTAHYISPNLWAWKKNRIKKMRKTLDVLCYIFPFERNFFAINRMPQAIYVGNPLLDAINAHQEKNLLPNEQRKIIALLPGSRRQEIKNSLPLMAKLSHSHPEYHFVVAGMSLLGRDIYDRYIPHTSNISILFDSTYEILRSAYAAIVCSGTATLETALFNVPQVVCYRGNPISYIIARAVVGHRINYISLVNLIADSPIVTELLQNDFNLDRLEQEFLLITSDDANRESMLSEYADMRTLLGNGGASRLAAETIYNTASSK